MGADLLQSWNYAAAKQKLCGMKGGYNSRVPDRHISLFSHVYTNGRPVSAWGVTPNQRPQQLCYTTDLACAAYREWAASSCTSDWAPGSHRRDMHTQYTVGSLPPCVPPIHETYAVEIRVLPSMSAPPEIKLGRTMDEACFVLEDDKTFLLAT
jgi:hypothetical protein